MNQAPLGKMRIYGCGGTGINIASYFNATSIETNCAEVLPVYVDTSRSNLRDDFKDEDIFILENVDGSGKVRKENHVEIANVLRQILLRFEPTDFNVVVFSASGGSGSVIGPLIMGELLARGCSAVACVVGSDESVITANNTLNTLKSLEAISKREDLPVVMYYEHNDRRRRESDVNQQLHLAISTLAVLSSRRNRRMDTKDIANWVQFNHTTSVGPQLAQLDIFTDSEEAAKVTDPIAIANIYASEDVEQLDKVAEYETTGYLTEDSTSFQRLHYLISIDGLPSIVNSIKKTLEQYNNQRNSRVKQASLLGDGDEVSEDGLVL